MTQFKRGAAALGTLTSEEGGNSPTSEFAKFSSGTTYKVRVKGTEDVMQYYGYGMYKKVNTFVPKNPPVRNERGYIVSGHTPWDLASQYYYDRAKEAEEAGRPEAEIKELRSKGYQFAGKERYAFGFYDLTTGQDIVIDLTRDQAKEVYAKIEKYAKKLDQMAFELSKTGQRQDTKVSLDPIIDLDEDLTPEERKNFEKSIGQPFDTRKFEGLLYEATEKEQIENLVKAGFDISLIGLTLGADTAQNDDVATPIEDEEPADDPAADF